MPVYFTNGYAVLIGVGESSYQPWSLPVTVHDTHALYNVLTDPEFCAYPQDEQHIRVLNDSGANRQAILKGIDWLAACSAADVEATVVVFFSGHGWLDPVSDHYYLIPADVDPYDIAGSAIAAAELSAALRRISSRRLLVILDCCHAGGMTTAKENMPALNLPGGLTVSAPPKALLDNLKQGAGRAIFSSSRGDQISWVRPDGASSLYTAHLIEALQGAGSRMDDTEVRLSNLMSYLSHIVPLSARTLGKEQTPYFDLAAEDFTVALIRGGKGGGLHNAPGRMLDHGAATPSIVQTFENRSPMQGAQGIFHGPITINVGAVPSRAPSPPNHASEDRTEE